MQSISKRKIERAIRELAPLSDSAQALLSLANDPDHCSQDVVQIVQRDAALTIRVLHIANSSVVAPMSPIESLPHAVSLMGERAVVTAALTVGRNWLQQSLAGYGPEAAGIFESGLKTAIAAELVAQGIGRKDLIPLAYPGGLLHDIGKVVLSEFMEPYVRALIDEVSSGPIIRAVAGAA